MQAYEREIRYIRLRDETGFFGVMKVHADFLTILVPSLGYYSDKSGKETFIAVDGGIFSVRDGEAFLLSDESEMVFSGMIQGIERSFIQKTVEFIKGKA